MGQTWIGGATGSFSVNANWLGNAAPAIGTLATPTNLTFFSGNAGAITATNDLGSPWVANSLDFNINNVNTFTLAGSVNTNQFVLANSPVLRSSGLGNAQIAGSNAAATSGPFGAQLLLADNLTFGGTGIGNITIGSSPFAPNIGSGIAETGGARSVTVPGGAPLHILRNLVLGGNNTFSGGLILDGGTVQTSGNGHANNFGATGSTMTVTPNGGWVNVATSLGSLVGLGLGTIQLNGDLHVTGSTALPLNNGTSTTPTVVQGSGNLYLDGVFNGLQISSNSSGFTGAVIIDQTRDNGLGISGAAGTLTLNTQAFNSSTTGVAQMGSLTGAASYDVRAGGSLVASNNTANSLQNGDRISDTAPIRLRNGNLVLNGPAALSTATNSNNYTPSDLTEKIGDVTGAGGNYITVTPVTAAGVKSTFELKSLSRSERGTFGFRGPALGDGSTAVRGRVILDTALPSTDFVGGGGAGGSKNISILPYAVGGASSTDSGSGFVTYGGDGFRLLTSAEYDLNPVDGSGNLLPGDPTNNVNVNTNTMAAPNDVTMNALLLGAGASADGSISGAGKLTITSGAVVSSGTHGIQTVANNMDFGSAEAVIFSNNSAGFRIDGKLTGNNGLTRSGASGAPATGNTLILTADNSGLHGPLTINNGILQYNQDLALPGDGTIVMNGAGQATNGINQSVALQWGGTTSTNLTRDIASNGGVANIIVKNQQLATTVALGNMHLAGTISGVGNVNFVSQASSTSVPTPGEIYVDNTANTYTGTTRFGGGLVHLASDGSTGVGGAWDIGSGGTAGIVFENSMSNSRPVNFEGTGTLDTKANSVTLNGPITGFVSWTGASSGPGLTKNGAGTLTLTSLVNNLGGLVTVNAGTLLINGNMGPSNSSNVVVNPGATLGGSGTIYRNTVGFSTVATGGSTKGGGTLSPGSVATVGTPGIMTIWGSLNLANTVSNGGGAVTLKMDLNGPVAGTGYDQIQTLLQNAMAAFAPGTAQLQLGDASASTPTIPANLQLSLGYAPAATDVFWLITNSNKYQDNLTADASHFKNITTGAFAGLPEGSSVTLGTFGGNTYTGIISYKGDFDSSNPAAGTGNDVVIYNVVPAPGSIALLGISGLLATRRKRRTA
jgi:autotransporter-associated beta strand protein